MRQRIVFMSFYVYSFFLFNVLVTIVFFSFSFVCVCVSYLTIKKSSSGLDQLKVI